MRRIGFVLRRFGSRSLQALALGLRAILPDSALRVVRRRASRYGDGQAPHLHRFARGLAELLWHAGIPPAVSTFAVEEGSGFARLVRCDSQIAARLYWLGSDGWEPTLVPYWRIACSGAKRITELGANVGYFSVVGGLATSGQYLAVEPHPVSAAVLRHNIAANGLLATVHVVEAAASPFDDRRQVTLSVPVVDRYSAPAGAFVDPADQRRGSRSTFRVGTIPVTEALAGSDLVKIDVEGMEAPLIEAARSELLARLPTIFLEVIDAEVALREVISSMLSTSKYRILLPISGGLTEIVAEEFPKAFLQQAHQTRDLILTADPVLLNLL